MKIDHICFAVKSIEEVIVYWETVFGYKQMTRVVENELQRVKVTFLSKEDSIMIKLIEPLPDNQSLVNFVRREGGFHHVCFRCSSLDEKMEELKEKGLRVLAPPQPGEAFNNNRIAFMAAKYGINIELIDTEQKTGIIDPVIY